MQFEDPKSILEAAAAQPTQGLDAHALVAKGTRLRRARLAAAVTGMAVVVAAASASFGMLADRRDDAAPGPAAPSERACPPSNRVSVYLRHGVATDEGRELARMLDRQVRDLNAASRVAYVSKRQAYRELTRRGRDVAADDDRELPWATLQARLDVHNVDDADLERLVLMLEEQIDMVQATVDKPLGGACAEVIRTLPGPETDGPLPPGDDPRTASVDLMRAECETGTIRLAVGPAEFTDGTKWCRFVLYVRNATGRPLQLDVDEQLLWSTRGQAVTPWEDAMIGDYSTRLFTSPLAPGRGRMGEVTFLVLPGDVPASLELQPDPGFAPISIELEYDCPADLRDEPGKRCLFSPRSDPVAFEQTHRRVEVTLWHCGVDPLFVAGQEWVVQDPPFDATNAPESFTGRGRFERKSAITAVYVDDGGEQILFEVVPDWEPPPCA